MDPELFDAIGRFFAEEIPFNRFLGMRLDAMEPGFARLSLPFREELVGDPIRPALHGGVIATLLDTCGGAALWSQLTMGDRVSTVDIRVDYLRPGRLEGLIAEGRVRRVGNRMGVVAVAAFHEGGEHEPVAEARAVYNIRRVRDGAR